MSFCKKSFQFENIKHHVIMMRTFYADQIDLIQI